MPGRHRGLGALRGRLRQPGDIVHRRQRPSDPRWRLEARCARPPTGPGQGRRLARASAALTAAGLAPAAPIPPGAAGFRWIDRDAGSVRVPGLCVHRPGAPHPLDVLALRFSSPV